MHVASTMATGGGILHSNRDVFVSFTTHTHHVLGTHVFQYTVDLGLTYYESDF